MLIKYMIIKKDIALLNNYLIMFGVYAFFILFASTDNSLYINFVYPFYPFFVYPLSLLFII